MYIPPRLQQLEIEDEVQLVPPVTIEDGSSRWCIGGRFTHQDRARVAVDDRTNGVQHFMRQRLIAIISMQLAQIRAEARTPARRVVGPLNVLADPVDRIQAKAIRPAIQLKADDMQHGVLDLRMMPVQIRLFFQE